MLTEQISFSLLNVKQMVNNPYGQYINGLWRESETREGLEVHMGGHFQDLDKVKLNDVDLIVNGNREHFNVLLFLVTDIGLLEKV